jgi:hypothetical protein
MSGHGSREYDLKLSTGAGRFYIANKPLDYSWCQVLDGLFTNSNFPRLTPSFVLVKNRRQAQIPAVLTKHE